MSSFQSRAHSSTDRSVHTPRWQVVEVLRRQSRRRSSKLQLLQQQPSLRHLASQSLPRTWHPVPTYPSLCRLQINKDPISKIQPRQACVRSLSLSLGSFVSFVAVQSILSLAKSSKSIYNSSTSPALSGLGPLRPCLLVSPNPNRLSSFSTSFIAL